MANKLGIITPTRGSSQYIARTLRSIEFHASFCTQIMVCPRGKAPTMQLPSAAHLLEESSGCKGVYGALHEGIEYAISLGCTHVTWINDDDELCEGFNSMWKVLDKTTVTPDIAYGRVEFIDRHNKRLGRAAVAKNEWWCRRLAACGEIPFTQQGAVISSQLWRNLGGFDLSLRLCADTDFFLRSIIRGSDVRYFPFHVANYRIHKEQLSQNQQLQSSEGYKLKARFIRKNASYIKMLFKLYNVFVFADRFMRTKCISVKALLNKYA